MKEIEVEGKTVTIAVEKGLKELGLRRDQVEVQVLEENSAGFLGLGSKPARVRLREKIWQPEETAGETPMPPAHKERETAHRPRRPTPERLKSQPEPKKTVNGEPPQDAPVDTQKACETASTVLKEILPLIGLTWTSVRCSWDDEQHRVKVEVESADSAILVGKAGQSLEALQFLATIITGRRMKVPVAVQVETEGYWQERESKILSEVSQAVDQVKRTGCLYRFDPMEPALRRLVHRKLAGHPDVETASEGEGPWRKVVLRPRRKAR